MVLLILAMVWIVLLAPSGWKWFSGRRSGTSIDTFHRELHLLEHTGPKLIAPAYRLHTAYSSAGLAPSQSGFPAVSSLPDRPPLVLLEPNHQLGASHLSDADEQVAVAPAGWSVAGSAALVGGTPRRVRPTSWQVGRGPGRTLATGTARARRRRRNVVAGLGATLAVTGLLGVAPHLHALWVVTGLAGGALLGFVGLAVYALTVAERAAPGAPGAPADRRVVAGGPRVVAAPSEARPSTAPVAPRWAPRRRPLHAAGARRAPVTGLDRPTDDGFVEGWDHAEWAGDAWAAEDDAWAGAPEVGAPQRYREDRRAAGGGR